MASPTLYRRRLINAINAPGHHIVYIYGPAGFGKTRLARDWMESQTLPTAWVEGFSTSNPAELFEIFLKEICEKVPHLSPRLEKLRNLSDVSMSHIIEFAQIIEADKSPFNIIIDNAEDIRRTHNQLSLTIVRLMPKHIKLILVTATSPRSDFVKDAGINRFTVVNPEELRFNSEEIQQIATEVIPGISKSEIKRLEEFTEGWPASIEIVTSLLKVDPELLSELSTLRLKGKHQFSLEVTRVLSKLETKQRELLKKLSLLKVITPENSFALTKDVDAVRQLTLMSQDSIIVSQVKQMPPIFKIHPIFRDELVDELRREEGFPSVLEEVIEKLLDQGEIRQATTILLELGETLRLVDILQDENLVRSVGVSIQDSISRSSVSELKDWLTVAEHLPMVGTLGRSIINFYIELLSGNFKAAESEIQDLEIAISNIDENIARQWRADVAALKSIISYAFGRLDENWQFAMRAYKLNLEAKDSEAKHQITYLQFALWAAVATDNTERVSELSKILDQLRSTNQSPQRNTTIVSMRALIAAYEGRLIEAQNYLVTPHSIVTKGKLAGFYYPYGNAIAESILAGEAGKLEKGIEILKSASDEAIAAENLPMAVALLGRLSYQYSLIRNAEQGLACIQLARKLIRDNLLSTELDSVVDIWEIRVRHFVLDNERVGELLRRCKPSYFVNSFQAAAAIGAGNFNQVRKLIDSFDLEVPRQAITYYLFKAYLLKDSPAAQLKEIAKAVDLGAKHGYFYHFVTQRSDILQQYISLASEFPTAFNERLAQAAGEELNKMMIAKSETGDALTKREADILRHLATGLPLKEIAQNLSISKNTIKTHLRNLYRKLGAEDRNDAVEKGKKLLKV